MNIVHVERYACGRHSEPIPILRNARVHPSGGCTPRATRAMARGSTQKIAEEA